MSTNKPYEISAVEWKEILQVPEVRELFSPIDTPESAASFAYGVKFMFTSKSATEPYYGELFIIQGVSLSDKPIILVRKKGSLQLNS